VELPEKIQLVKNITISEIQYFVQVPV